MISVDQLNDVRRRHSTVRLEESYDGTSTEQFSEVEDFDKGADFEVYFPHFNLSNLAPPKNLIRRSCPTTFINIRSSD